MAPLTEDQIEDIAEKAADKAIKKLTDHIYQEVGKSVIRKFVYIVGVMTVGAYVFGRQKGWW